MPRLLAGRYTKKPWRTACAGGYRPQYSSREGWVKGITNCLDEEKIGHTIFSGVSPNPRDEEVMKGAQVFKESGCDSLVAVGGGSPIDCAKGIGIVSSNGKHILEFEGVDNTPVPSPPLICIPTTRQKTEPMFPSLPSSMIPKGA